MINGKLLVEKLIVYAQNFLYLSEYDVVYTRNLLLGQFNLISAEINPEVDYAKIASMTIPDELFNEVMQYASENKLCEEGYEEVYATYIFGLISPKPSEVNMMMRSLREKMGAKYACEYLYNLSIKNNYIRKSAIDKNIGWEYKDGDRMLEITINLSKPEKDNKDIAKLVSAPKDTTKYPLCLLCRQNEGYKGTLTHPARTNLRIFSVDLGGEKWYMQYSPYAYFYQHCILLSNDHVPMKISRKTVEKLFDFIELVPHYFAGSNSDLPIVGGSILNHEHYQGGYHEMPMHKAKIARYCKHDGYPDVEIGIVNWYNTTIRLSGYNRNTVAELAGAIIDGWRKYSDPSVDIIGIDENGVNHSTCTVITRFLPDNRYSVDLILRNNCTSEKYPDGIFHAHPEYHNIKKEGIGLIEAMGLYILPARLKRQLAEIQEILVGRAVYSPIDLSNPDNSLYVHRDMIAQLIKENPDLTDDKKAKEVIDEYVNRVCVNILKNTAVFKQDEQGVRALNKFLASVQII
ncbi:MAG: UDP-glucose--hexose-1-phosphate uridylyltransferase [Clostridia bacterium]|nr:UDP-glucose--hexose-1-phosphate uridylyltransferase [Clostridia bacterium]